MTEIALIGNPNSGKTSLFNLITGNNQRVGNWPGVTLKNIITRCHFTEIFDFVLK